MRFYEYSNKFLKKNLFIIIIISLILIVILSLIENLIGFSLVFVSPFVKVLIVSYVISFLLYKYPVPSKKVGKIVGIILALIIYITPFIIDYYSVKSELINYLSKEYNLSEENVDLSFWDYLILKASVGTEIHKIGSSQSFNFGILGFFFIEFIDFITCFILVFYLEKRFSRPFSEKENKWFDKYFSIKLEYFMVRNILKEVEQTLKFDLLKKALKFASPKTYYPLDIDIYKSSKDMAVGWNNKYFILNKKEAKFFENLYEILTS